MRRQTESIWGKERRQNTGQDGCTHKAQDKHGTWHRLVSPHRRALKVLFLRRRRGWHTTPLNHHPGRLSLDHALCICSDRVYNHKQFAFRATGVLPTTWAGASQVEDCPLGALVTERGGVITYAPEWLFVISKTSLHFQESPLRNSNQFQVANVKTILWKKSKMQ